MPRLTPTCSALDRPPAHSTREPRSRFGGSPSPVTLAAEEGARRRRGARGRSNPRFAGLRVARSPPLGEERGSRGHQRHGRCCGAAVEAGTQPVGGAPARAAASIGEE
jgi:hypothetical protein